MRLSPLLAGIALLVPAFVLTTPPASASPTSEWTALGHGKTVAITGRPGDGTSTIVNPVDRSGRALSTSSLGTTAVGASSPTVLSSSALSTWNVTYDAAFDANAPAKAAFQRAVTTWSRAVASSVPITVDAHLFHFADPSVLGGAGPNNAFDPNNQGVYYPSALANSLAGRDLDGPATADIGAKFADNPSLFYYGADPTGISTASCKVPPATAPSPGTCYDFESVVLHELGHGLGFVGTPDVDSRGIAYYGVTATDPTPLIFDTFAETANGTPILNYPNHSSALTAALTGNAVYWGGGHGASADRGREPRLFADAPFQSGTTFSHLSDASYPKGDPNGLMTPYAEQADVTRDPGEVTLGMFRDMGWVTPGLPGSTFTALTPTRVLDTAATKLGNGQYRDLLLAGRFGVPSNATAVVLNVTAALPTSASVVRVFPVSRSPGAPVPTVSNLNTATGDNRANLVTASLSTGGPTDGTRAGRVRLLNTGGSTRLVADLAGYYAPNAATYFHPVVPVRLMDTRNGTGVPQQRVGQGGTVDLTVTNNNGVPANAAAVTLTLTAVTPSTNTYVSAYPTGTAPTTSNINLNHGTVAANQVVVKVGTAGQVTFRNNAGTVDLVADLAGWYDSNSTGGTLFRPTLPTRIVDTRPGVVAHAGVSDAVVVSAANGVPTTATAAVLNLTGVAPTAPTFLTAYPQGSTRPTASNLNLARSQTAAALATVKTGPTGRVSVYNAAGTVGLVVDLSGWFGPP